MLAVLPAWADTLRVATYHPNLTRNGPGLLLRDIRRGGDAQIDATIRVIVAARPDILLLTAIDHDARLTALLAFRDRLAEAGLAYPHLFARRPNSGVQSGLDLDGNGKKGEPRDAQGYGRFAGQGGMAILSRLPLVADEAEDLTGLLWRDLPGHSMTDEELATFGAVQRLSSAAHWVVPVLLPSGARFELWAFSATPPVFDGPSDRNGRRNRDELLIWQQRLETRAPDAPPVVLAGNVNIDPADGEGRSDVLAALLAGPHLHDPRPASPGARAAANPGHGGDPGLDTADYSDPRPGNLRVDYVLPSRRFDLRGSGVMWPAADALPVAEAGRRRLVWVDLRLRP